MSNPVKTVLHTFVVSAYDDKDLEEAINLCREELGPEDYLSEARICVGEDGELYATVSKYCYMDMIVTDIDK